MFAEALRIISEKYKSEEVSDEIYVADIIELKDLMMIISKPTPNSIMIILK